MSSLRFRTRDKRAAGAIKRNGSEYAGLAPVKFAGQVTMLTGHFSYDVNPTFLVGRLLARRLILHSNGLLGHSAPFLILGAIEFGKRGRIIRRGRNRIASENTACIGFLQAF